MGCLTEAMMALVEVFAEVGDTPISRVMPVSVQSSPDRDLLISLLEEEIYTVEVFGVVPARFHLHETDDGAVAGDMEVVDASEVELVGPVPKAVAYHGLEFAQEGGTWRCRAVVDV
ncbi:MAG: archease [Acidimicrobiales bacterium]